MKLKEEVATIEMAAGMEECRAHRLYGPSRAEGQGVHGAMRRLLPSNKPRKTH